MGLPPNPVDPACGLSGVFELCASRNVRPFLGLGYLTPFKLVRFDTVTGLGSVIGTVGSSGQTFPSLRFDPAGTAYTVEAGSGNVYTVNLTTGQGTLLFAGGAAAINTRGLALPPASGCGTCSGDINADAHVDGMDVGGWVRCALGAGQPADACSCNTGVTTPQFIDRLLNATDTACP